MILASELSLEAVLLRIVELAVDLTDARYGALGVLTPDGRLIEEFITVGISPEDRAALGEPPTGHGLLGALITEARPLRIPDISADPRSFGFPPNHPPMKSLLGAPVAGRGKVFGNIYLTDKQGAETFDEEDERVLVVLATQAAIAVENARVRDESEHKSRELQRLQVVEERERIGKELHDGVIQSLFAVGMSLQGLAAASSDPEMARRLEGAVEDVDHAIRDLRNYIFGLRPGILADRQLDEALKEMASEFGSRTGVVTVVDVDGAAAAELASRAGDVVQLAREALSNVGRHGAATTCRVSLRRGDAGLFLEIDDDGRGFDADMTSWGMGLQNLRERVEPLGGAARGREHDRRRDDDPSDVPVLRGSRRNGDHRPLPRRPDTGILVHMFARYFVELPMFPGGSRASPVSGPAALWLPGLAERAHHRGDVLLAEVGFGEAVRIKRTVAVELGRSVRTGSTFVFPLRWAASAGAGLFPSLDADLEVAPIRPGRTQLAMSARYDPPFGTVGRVIDRAVLSRVAEATLKDFLDRVADDDHGIAGCAEPLRAASSGAGARVNNRITIP